MVIFIINQDFASSNSIDYALNGGHGIMVSIQACGSTYGGLCSELQRACGAGSIPAGRPLADRGLADASLRLPAGRPLTTITTMTEVD